MFNKFLDPKNDVAFKRIFGTEKNKDILIHFLNDVITSNKRPAIKDVTFLRTIQDPDIAAHKTSVVDILCVDDKENRYIVEMQVAKEKGFEKRAMFYAARAYTSQMRVGGEYHDLKEVIFLAIADFTMFPHRTGYKSEHVILEKDTHDHDLKDFSFTFLELSKFHKGINDLSSMTDKWMYFFKHAYETPREEWDKLAEGDDALKKAYKELDQHYWNEGEFMAYEHAVKNAWVDKARMDHMFDEGIKNVAQKMLLKGIRVEAISELTGLTREEVEAMDASDKEGLTAQG